MEHFPPRATLPLTEPEIAPHFAAQPAQTGGPNPAPSSHHNPAEETTLGKDNNGQDHWRQLDGTNAALRHDVNNSPCGPQAYAQEADTPQSPPPRTQIRYPTLPPSPPALLASEQTYPHHHLSPSYLCHSRDCGWKVAYLKLRCITRKLIDETDESVRGFRWAVDNMERKMSANADFLEDLDGGWRGCGGTPDVEGVPHEVLRGVGGKVAWGVELSTEAPPKSSRHDGVVVYPDLPSDLSRLEREEDRLGVMQRLGGAVAPRSKSSPGVPPQYRGDGVLDGDIYPELQRTVSRV